MLPSFKPVQVAILKASLHIHVALIISIDMSLSHCLAIVHPQVVSQALHPDCNSLSQTSLCINVCLLSGMAMTWHTRTATPM